MPYFSPTTIFNASTKSKGCCREVRRQTCDLVTLMDVAQPLSHYFMFMEDDFRHVSVSRLTWWRSQSCTALVLQADALLSGSSTCPQSVTNAACPAACRTALPLQPMIARLGLWTLHPKP